MLATERFGSGAPLLALHGFTHTSEQFEPLAERIGRQIHAPDLPGHGRSVAESAQIDDVVASLTESITAVGTSMPILGYSQGARLALLLATQTSCVTGPLILVSGTAGIEDKAERRDRRAWDRSTGERIIEIGIEAFIDEWTSTGITSTAGLPSTIRHSDKEERLRNTAHGLAAALTGYGTGTMPSVWHLLGSIAVPTLVLSGSTDGRYTELGGRMAAEIGDNASLSVIQGAGHDPFLSRPDDTADVIREFLSYFSIGTAEPEVQS